MRFSTLAFGRRGLLGGFRMGASLGVGRSCLKRTSRPWLPVKGFNISNGVYVFVLAKLAAGYEAARVMASTVIKLILQTRNLRRDGNRFFASNARHCAIAFR